MRLPFLTRNVAANIRAGKVADAPALARLHATSFAHPWSVVTIESMLADRGIFAHVAEGRGVSGFILTRLVLDEAEILSVAVDTSMRRAGIGHRLVEANISALMLARARQVFLEVEAANHAATALYNRLGFDQIGRRAGYYRKTDGTRQDALTMRLDLDNRQPPARVVDV